MAVFRDLSDPAAELDEAVSMLADPRQSLPSLLDQLEEAMESSSGRSGSAARSRQTVPVSLDVVMLLKSIDAQVLIGLRRVGYSGRFDGDRAPLVRQWAASFVRKPRWIYAAIADARRWVTRAEHILTPDSQLRERRAQA
ncbi:MAG: DUF7341 domain-containing protein, partial [Gammaproteobacteria bacterium]